MSDRISRFFITLFLMTVMLFFLREFFISTEPLYHTLSFVACAITATVLYLEGKGYK